MTNLMSQQKPFVLLKNWRFQGGYLSGDAYNHPRFRDGEFVRTSVVQAIVKEADDAYIVETLNTFYILIPPRPITIEEEAKEDD